MAHRVRLVLDVPLSGTLNMAIDEMFLERQAKGSALPVLRIYFWKEPSWSVGYFQKAEKRNFPVVRRLTGGGAVLHDKDLTFSLIFPQPNPFFTGGVKGSYLAVNEALRAGLAPHFPGLDFADCKTVPSGRAVGKDRVCFDSPSCHDLLLKGKKVVGASQRRVGGALLHQSTVFLNLEKDLLVDLICRGFESKMNMIFEPVPLSEEELISARKKESERYSSRDWAS
ncbi:MAG: lipoate--protein ligase family protein [Candidatus Omnitrophica bacterium]|nr:lipoate--protein ligase family protein [Candidatus Omnitrophota bacterium]